EQNILALPFTCTITEILRNGQAGKRHTGTGPGRFVHLSKNKGRFGLLHYFFIYFGQIPSSFFHRLQEIITIFYNTGFQHLTQQIVPLTGTFPHSCKYGKSPVSLCNIVDQFLDQYRLAHTGTSKKTDLTSLGIRFDQVDYLNTGKQYLGRSGQVLKLGCIPVDRKSVLPGFWQIPQAIYSIPDHVKKATINIVPDRHLDCTSCCNYGNSPT